MLGQSKTVWQAEIDSAAETIDFWRFNVKFAEEIYQMQPPVNSKGVWNRSEYRPLVSQPILIVVSHTLGRICCSHFPI